MLRSIQLAFSILRLDTAEVRYRESRRCKGLCTEEQLNWRGISNQKNKLIPTSNLFLPFCHLYKACIAASCAVYVGQTAQNLPSSVYNTPIQPYNVIRDHECARVLLIMMDVPSSCYSNCSRTPWASCKPDGDHWCVAVVNAALMPTPVQSAFYQRNRRGSWLVKCCNPIM